MLSFLLETDSKHIQNEKYVFFSKKKKTRKKKLSTESKNNTIEEQAIFSNFIFSRCQKT